MTEKKFDARKTLKKWLVAFGLIVSGDIAIQLVTMAQADILDASVRSVLISALFAVQNFIKHRDKK
jgi:hypothetical protein